MMTSSAATVPPRAPWLSGKLMQVHTTASRHTPPKISEHTAELRQICRILLGNAQMPRAAANCDAANRPIAMLSGALGFDESVLAPQAQSAADRAIAALARERVAREKLGQDAGRVIGPG